VLILFAGSRPVIGGLVVVVHERERCLHCLAQEFLDILLCPPLKYDPTSGDDITQAIEWFTKFSGRKVFMK